MSDSTKRLATTADVEIGTALTVDTSGAIIVSDPNNLQSTTGSIGSACNSLVWTIGPTHIKASDEDIARFMAVKHKIEQMLPSLSYIERGFLMFRLLCGLYSDDDNSIKHLLDSSERYLKGEMWTSNYCSDLYMLEKTASILEDRVASDQLENMIKKDT